MSNVHQYAWYSEKQDKHGVALNIYRLIGGREVVVTNISSSPDDSGTLWDDILYLGEVDSYVRTVREPERL